MSPVPGYVDGSTMPAINLEWWRRNEPLPVERWKLSVREFRRWNPTLCRDILCWYIGGPAGTICVPWSPEDYDIDHAIARACEMGIWVFPHGHPRFYESL
jgi:hypothetical protein